MEFTSSHDFTHDPTYQLKCFSTREGKEILLQWGLENNLKINRFKINGNVHHSDSKQIAIDFFSNLQNQRILGLEGSVESPVTIDQNELRTTIRSMEFFDRLEPAGIIGPSGSIMGCFDETFDGVTVSDRLKEMLVNPDSENSTLFNIEEKNELIYKIFSILYIGGAMSQPDATITRYLDFTKQVYKELLILFKTAGTGEIKSACRIFEISNVSGLVLFPSTANSTHSHFILVINHLEKYIVTLQINYTSFWS